MGMMQSYVLYYIIILLTPLIASFSSRVKEIKGKKIIFWIALICPVLISGLRYGIGTDFFSYEGIYRKLTTPNDFLYDLQHTGYEPGWILINNLIKFLFDDVQFLFIITSLLIWIFNFKAIFDNRKNLNVGVAVLILMSTMFNDSLNIIRQSLASSILLMSVKPALDKKKTKFIFIVLFATSVHYFAFLFLITYWLVNSKTKGTNVTKKVLAFVGAFIILLTAPSLISLITSIDMFSYYSRYNLTHENIKFGIILLRMPIVLIILFNIKKLRNRNKFYKVIPLYFIGLIILNLGYLGDFVSRIGKYFEMLQIFILSAIVIVQKGKYEKFLMTLVIVAYYIAWFTYNYIIRNRDGTIPYDFFF